MSAFQYCLNDHTFGPAVTGCRDDFDFTVKFEAIVLSLLPSLLFICAALPRLWQLSSSKSVVQGSQWLLITKTVLGTAYCGTVLATLIVGSSLKQQTKTSTAAHALAFTASILVLPLSVLEHYRHVKPSFLLNIYLFFSTLFDIAQTRTQWLVTSESEQPVLFAELLTATVAVKAALLVAEARRKNTLHAYSREEKTGLFGLLAYTWLNPLFQKGYSKVLCLEDLAKLDESIDTEKLHRKLSAYLAHAETPATTQRFELVKALLRTIWKPMLLPVLPRLGLVGFRFCQPFLVEALLSHMEDPRRGDTGWENEGFGFIGAAIIIYFGVASSTALYWYCQERFQSIVRGALVAAIYQTLTTLKIVDVNDSAAVTLMSSDIERIRVGLWNLHEFWATPVEAALASWLLYTHLGVAFVAPLVVVICSVVSSAWLNAYTDQRQKRWMDSIQTRVAQTVHMLVNIKQLKISDLAHPVEESTQALRANEMKAASKFRRLYVSNMAFGFAPMALCPLITFAVTARNLDKGTIFTSLAYLVLLADPLGILFGEIPYLLAAFTSLGRIQEFLSKETRRECRDFCQVTFGSSSGSDSDPKSSLTPGVTLEKVTMGWVADFPVFQNLSIRVPPSNLTIIIGPVGSGKSTLCKAILSEIPSISGKIKISSLECNFRSAFCDQSPHIYNSTIRQNITGFHEVVDEARYREVIEATALTKDLRTMPKGGDTIVGSSGMTLSGGQKQRISMARALYHNANFYIFDDSLSGLDADTELEVFSRMFGPTGVLTRRRATVLLATHNARLHSLAQHLIILEADGIVRYEGSYNGLVAEGVQLPSVLALKSVEAETPSLDSDAKLQHLQEETHVIWPDPGNSNNTTSFLSDEDRMTGDSTVYRYYLTSLGKLSFVAFGLFGVGWGFFYNFGYIWLRFWADDTDNSHSRAYYIGLYALWQASGLASIVLCFWTSYTMMARVSGLSLHRSALQSVIRAPLWFSTTTDIGVITNLFSQDMTLVDNELPQAITNLALDVCNALGLAAVIATSSPYLAISYPILMAILYFIQKIYLRTSRQIRLLDLEAKSPLYTHFVDTAKGLATLRAFGWVNKSISEAFELLDKSQKPTYLLAMVQRWLLLVLQCMVACIAIIVVTLATQTVSDGSGFTGASLVALMTFGEILNYIIRWWAQLETSIGAVTRLKALNDKIPEEGSNDETEPLPPDWPSQGRVEMSNISASYEQDASESIPHSLDTTTEKPRSTVLESFSASIAAGDKVAICGRSGRADVRNRIIAMSQESVFLPGHISLRRQLDPRQLSDPGQCVAVLQLVGLGHLAGIPADLETNLDPESLSGGQRQLFCLARTVLRGRARAQRQIGSEKIGGLLLLDEVSASMDHHTEEIMQRVIMDEFKNYTIITVSHRLKMILDYDTVLVMESGRLVEQGNPKALSADDKSRFGQLWSAGGN